MIRFFSVFALCVFAAMLAASCTTLNAPEDEDHSAAIGRLERRLSADPDDLPARRDLGILYMRAQLFVQARSHLEQAYAHFPNDAELMFYYGLSLETAEERSAALRVYERYREMPRTSPYRKRLAGRYEWLVREVVREELQQRLAQEEDFAAAPPNTVAVFPLRYQGDDERYAPLGRGLSEMVAVDLSRIASLKVVERVRLNALLQELELGQREVVDPATAPRVGRILAAGRVVGGSYAILEGDLLRVDAASWQIDDAPTQRLSTQSDALANLFALEKELVLSLLDDLGVELTPEEREALERVPTRNLQAFLAYCRGLLDEDAGRFGSAAGFFRQAQTLDPGFDEAAESAEAVEAVDEVSGAPETIAVTTGAPAAPSPTDDLLQSRQQNLGDGIGTLYVPGQDAREPGTEPANADLPTPRRPPPREN